MKKAIQAKNLSRFLFLLRNCKYTHFTLDKSGFTNPRHSFAFVHMEQFFCSRKAIGKRL